MKHVTKGTSCSYVGQAFPVPPECQISWNWQNMWSKNRGHHKTRNRVKMLSMWDNEDIPEDARPPLDQIFNLLQQEYPEGEIDYRIAKRLKNQARDLRLDA